MRSNIIRRLRDSYLGQAWLVLFLSICFGGSLAAVQTRLGPVIEQNKINETFEKVPELLLGRELAQQLAARNQAPEIVPQQVTVDANGKQVVWTIYRARYQDKDWGCVVKSSGRGYADAIELLVGVDPKINKIRGLYILDQKETPGLGNRILEEAWRDQFIGKSAADPIIVVKNGAQGDREVNAISGATISSKSVAQIVNQTTLQLRQALSGQ